MINSKGKKLKITMNNRYLIHKTEGVIPTVRYVTMGGKAMGLRSIEPSLVPDWICITSDCPDDKLANVVEAASSMCRWETSLSKYGSYAVRSSAVGEDGDNKSFAGIFESKLNVPITGLEHAVREVRDSANAARSEAYLQSIRKPMDIAVIIMPMVDAKYSGVLFTKEPVDGTNRMLVEYQEGVGGVVDGTSDSTMFFLDPENFWDSEWEIMPKCMEQPMQQIYAEAKRLENNYRKPMDIEWAIDKDNKPWILQARPITAGVTA